MIIPSQLVQQVNAHPYPLLFATISGAHLYGFPSPNSDYDLRGVHILPIEEVVGLQKGPETIEKSGIVADIDLDLVSHDVRKFFGLMLKANGYVMEQVFSPLVVQTSNVHSELREIARTCLTRHHVHHYLGFASNQWKLFRKDQTPRIKPLLYVYRVLMTGIHLMKTGEIEANLVALNETMRVPHVADLIQRKLSEPENSVMGDADLEDHTRQFERLIALLEESSLSTKLPDLPLGRGALNNLLIRLRTGGTRLCVRTP